DAPGMNAVIRAITRAGIALDLEVYGVRGGFKGLYDNEIFKLGRKSVSEKLNRGGTFLQSARFPEFMNDDVVKVAADNLRKHNIENIIVIGGDGSFKGAMSLSRFDIKVIGIPATIDNDIASTDFTVGFDTAVNTAVEAIDRIRDTSNSHKRCSIIEVMGRDCGDIALHSGVATGAEAIYVDGESFTYDSVCKVVEEAQANYKKHALIIIAENICNVIDLAEYVEKKTQYTTRSTILGHVQRGGTPSAFDRYLASNFGAYAIKLILEDTYNVALGTNGANLFYTPIKDAVEMKNNDKEYFFKAAELLK
ncbi:MAG: 6-phosphofructokinase, partial [Erysipelotrichales bacterium]